MNVLIANGRIVTAEGELDGDVLVEGSRIAAVGGDLAARAADARVIDAGGLFVLPGLLDFHVHADDEIGRYAIADDFTSASRAALLGGVTTMVSFATQRSGETLAGCAARFACKVRNHSLCDVAFHLTPTGDRWDWAELVRLAGRGFRTVKLYTTYRQAGLYSSWAALADIMPRLAELGLRLLLHCEDDAVLAAVDPRGIDLCDPSSHTRLRPPEAEVVAIEQAVALAATTGCPLHVVHVSTPQGARCLAAARPRHEVSGETCPQYVFLDDAALRAPGGHRLLCAPPLRSPTARAELERLVADGALDILATDHCPFGRREKDSFDGDIRTVPGGIPGLGALSGLAHALLVERHGKSLSSVVQMVATTPARLAGLLGRKGTIAEGADADLVILDPAGPVHALRSTLANAHDPWAGSTTRLHFRHVLLRGVEVVRDGKIVTSKAHGIDLQG